MIIRGFNKVWLSCSHNQWFTVLIMWPLRMNPLNTPTITFPLISLSFTWKLQLLLGGRQYAKGDLWIIDDSIINCNICNHVEVSDNWLSQQDNQTLNPYYIRMLLLLQQWKLSNTSAMWKSNKDPWLGFKVPTTSKSLDIRNQTRILDY
jgi:hypothetical protein